MDPNITVAIFSGLMVLAQAIITIVIKHSYDKRLNSQELQPAKSLQSHELRLDKSLKAHELELDKRLKTHDLKLGRYLPLIDAVSKLPTDKSVYPKFSATLNAALCFASDDTVRELLIFNDIIIASQEKRQAVGIPGPLITDDHFKPVLVAIRKDLNLESKSLDDRKLRFFTGTRDALEKDR